MLRTTVIAKTDIVQSTRRIRQSDEAMLVSLLESHERLIRDIVSAHQGIIIKGGGDSFWIIYPSVTTAALASIEIQRQLRLQQAGYDGEKRLAVRAVIALGDVLHRDNDVFGAGMSLAARMEEITPGDTIYLSEAAWLALNHGEVQTRYVGEFDFKGFERSKVYQVEFEYTTRILRDVFVLMTDLTRFIGYYTTHPVDEVERMLIAYDALVQRVCLEHQGVIRQVLGDGFFLTFPTAVDAIQAANLLQSAWLAYIVEDGVPVGLQVGMARGDLYSFRSYLYGVSLNEAYRIGHVGSQVPNPLPNGTEVMVTVGVVQALADTAWQARLVPITAGNDEVAYRLVPAEG